MKFICPVKQTNKQTKHKCLLEIHSKPEITDKINLDVGANY